MVVLLMQGHALFLPLEHQKERQRKEPFSGSSDCWGDKGGFRHHRVELPSSSYKPPWVYNRLPPSIPLHLHREQNPCHGEIQALCEQGQLDGALDALSRLDTATSTHLYLSLLKACNCRKDLAHAKRVRAHLAQHRVELAGLLGDYLVVTLAKCGAIEEALEVFHTLAHGTVFSWTAIISAYNASGRGEKALEMYDLMQEEGVEPDCRTFVSLFKACGTIHDLQQGKKLHTEARRKGLASDVYVSNTLVSMYGKCGSIVEAENVFGAMPERNFASWTSMISAYVEQGQGENALRLYRQMQEENVSPNQHTFAVILQACYGLCDSKKAQGTASKLMCLEIGQALHADVQRSGLASNVVVGTTLVHMYGKCGRIKEAEHVYVALSHCDSVSWNAMLSAYIEQGQGEMALRLYRYMQEQGVTPDQKTFVIALQACVILAENEEAIVVEGQSTKAMSVESFKALHADAQKKGFASNVFFGTTLLGMYAKCGIIVEAENAFCELSRRDVVSWTAMLNAYVEHGEGEKALHSFRQMQEEGVGANEQTFVIAIQACGTLRNNVEDTVAEGLSLEIGMALHADARRRGIDSNVFVSTALVGMYGTCGTIAEAESVFGGLPQRDLVSWNAMLTVYVEQGHGEKALQLYRMMLEEGMSPDQKTFVIVLQACSTLAEKEETKFSAKDRSIKLTPLEFVLALHDDVQKKGFASDVFVGNTLMTVYGNCGTLLEAENVFNALSHHEIVSWNVMLSLYVEHCQGEKALQLYSQMQDEGVTLNDVTLVCILQACSETGSLKTCNQLHFSIVSAGYDLNPSLAATLIHAYGNCANMIDAQTVFNGLSQPDIVSWNACIAGYAGEGNYAASVQMLEEMQLTGTKPDGVTLASVLSACSHSGLVVQGLEYFESLCRVHGINPDLKHFSSTVDLLGRAGDLKRLESILRRMPMRADLSIWLPLLGACRVHGNAELGKQAFDYAINLKPKEATAYVLMSNIYADFGLLECTDEEENSGWEGV